MCKNFIMHDKNPSFPLSHSPDDAVKVMCDVFFFVHSVAFRRKKRNFAPQNQRNMKKIIEGYMPFMCS